MGVVELLVKWHKGYLVITYRSFVFKGSHPKEMHKGPGFDVLYLSDQTLKKKNVLLLKSVGPKLRLTLCLRTPIYETFQYFICKPNCGVYLYSDVGLLTMSVN